MIGAILATVLLIGGGVAATSLFTGGSSDDKAGNDDTKVADSGMGFTFKTLFYKHLFVFKFFISVIP